MVSTAVPGTQIAGPSGFILAWKTIGSTIFMGSSPGAVAEFAISKPSAPQRCSGNCSRGMAPQECHLQRADCGAVGKTDVTLLKIIVYDTPRRGNLFIPACSCSVPSFANANRSRGSD